MNFNNAVFEMSAGLARQLPESTFPEVVFSGRSNVGKSSLLNKILNRKALARVSATPGKTITINFYKIDDGRLVDLPGYGYAKTTLETRAKWGKMIQRYLSTSKQLQRVFLLIDIRHAPSENDRLMYEWIVSEGYEPVIIATKLDKIKRSQHAKQIKAVRTGLGLSADDILIPVSSQTKQGIPELWDVIEQFI